MGVESISSRGSSPEFERRGTRVIYRVLVILAFDIRVALLPSSHMPSNKLNGVVNVSAVRRLTKRLLLSEVHALMTLSNTVDGDGRDLMAGC